MALCGGLSPEQTIRLAEANNAPFIEVSMRLIRTISVAVSRLASG